MRRGSLVTGSGRQLSPRGPNRRGSAGHQATGDGCQGWVDTPQVKTTGKTNPKHRLADDPRAQCFEVRLDVGEFWQGARPRRASAAPPCPAATQAILLPAPGPGLREWISSICSSLSLIHISEPTRLRRISYAVFCLK